MTDSRSMKIILAMVLSLDGKSTKADLSLPAGQAGPNLWASVEDQGFFHDLKHKIGTIIVGRKTWEAAGRPQGDGIRRIVMSRRNLPAGRQAGFELPTDVDTALLVGGSELNAEFFRRGLVDEMYLTIEPKIFGSGLPLAQAEGLEVQLELLSVRQLNPQGTLLLHYKCLNNKK